MSIYSKYALHKIRLQILAFKLDGKVFTTTRRRMDSEQAVWAKAWIQEHGIASHLEPGWTYMFEAVYPANRVVVNYNFNGLVLLGAFTPHGAALGPGSDETFALAAKLGVVCPPSICDTAEVLRNTLPMKWSGPSTGPEGWVLLGHDGTMSKWVSDHYKEGCRKALLLHPLAVWDRIRCGGEDKVDLLNGLPQHLAHDMKAICTALERAYDEVLEQLASIVKCSLPDDLCKTQLELRNTAAPPRHPHQHCIKDNAKNALIHRWLQEEETMGTAEGLNTGDNIRLMDAAIEETRLDEEVCFALESLDVNEDSSRAIPSTEMGSLEKQFEPKDEHARLEHARLTLQRTIELAIHDKDASLKGELPLTLSLNVYGRQRQDNGYLSPQLLASEPFLRALRFVIEEVGASFHTILEDGTSQPWTAMYYKKRKQTDWLAAEETDTHCDTWRNSVRIRVLVLDCIQPDSDGTLFRYTPSNVVLQTWAKGWKQGPQSGRLASPPSLLLKLEPGLLGTILDNLHGADFVRTALFVCKQLAVVARSGSNFISKMTAILEVQVEDRSFYAGAWLSDGSGDSDDHFRYRGYGSH